MKSIIASSDDGQSIPDLISLNPEPARGRYEVGIWVRELRVVMSKPDLPRETMNDGSFQGQHARIIANHFGEYTHWSVIIERRDRWFEVGLSIPNPDIDLATMPPELWKPYLESFRVEAAPATTRASGT